MAHVKLILLQDVEDLGLAGEEVHVAAGYARNYLIPRGFATVASTGVLRQLEARKEKIEAKRKADLEAAQALSAKIATLDITIPMPASEDGHLSGSVSERTLYEKPAWTPPSARSANSRSTSSSTRPSPPSRPSRSSAPPDAPGVIHA